MSTAQIEVQTAMYAALMPSGALDTVLASAGCLAVYDFRAVPENASFDYITLGDCYEMPNDSLTTYAYTLYPTVHIWSRQLGAEFAGAMLARLDDLFHRRPLTLATLKHVSTMRQRATFLDDPDGLTLHVAVQYEIKAEK